MTEARRLVFTSPLEPELVERVRAASGGLDVVYPAELLATPRYPSAHPLPSVEKDGARERWDELLDGAEILFDFGPAALASELPGRPRLRWIQATSAGVGRFAERAGLLDSEITITTASGPHARPLAEFALLAMLMFGKNTLHLTRQQREHRWERHADEEVRGKVVCVVGLGKIGREVARLAARARRERGRHGADARGADGSRARRRPRSRRPGSSTSSSPSPTSSSSPRRTRPRRTT